MADKKSRERDLPLIGLLAVKNHLVTKKELQAALKHCAGAPDLSIALKKYMIEHELISPENAERLNRAIKTVALRKKELKFGVIAIRKGFINQSVLKLVLEEQQNDIKAKKKVRLIGDMLVEAGMLTLKQKEYVLSLQNRISQEGVNQKDKNRDEDQKPKKNKTAETDPPLNNGAKETQDNGTKKQPAAEAIEKEGQKQTEDSSKDESPGLLEPEVIVGGIKLQIAEDYMAAFMSKTDYFDENVAVNDIKEALFDKGIVLGVVADEMIQGFVKSSGFKTKAFRVAKGVVPIDGKDARVEFFFNTDYLKAGGMTQDGTIDFKERGEIPHVEEGTVLAEKIPMVEARSGHNIYGDEIPTMPGRDLPLKYGKGTKLSEDGFKVLAAVKGFPKYGLSGHIFVYDVYTTPGDVDYETGHVQYDGNVDVKGRVKSGFKVIGNDVSVIELDGGVVDAQGNVTVSGGINEGTIYARGNVYAKFIHNSTVSCMGDVVVQKEIVDSTIENSGRCVVESGKLISSVVTSKMGIQAKNIGTEMAGPSKVQVGYDIFTEKELATNQEKIDKVRKQIGFVREKQEALKKENLELQKQITELAHVQDRSQLEEKQVVSKISEVQQNGGSQDEIDALNSQIGELRENAKKAEENLDLCFDKSEDIEDLLEKEDTELTLLNKRMVDFKDERSNLIQWSKENPGKAVVIVEGALMPETLIKGLHSETRISEKTRHVRVSEVLCTSENGQSLNIYEMQIGSI